MSERLPNGGALALMLWYSPDMKSYAIAYDDRTASRPSPCTSHATPKRGERFPHCLSSPVFALSGKPSSPAYSTPAGALRNTVLLTPRWKFSMLNTEMTPFSTFCPKNGSQRTPAFTVTRLDARHVSWAYAAGNQLLTGSLPNPPCSTVVTRPTRTSAQPRPVALPSKIQLPLAREVEV